MNHLSHAMLGFSQSLHWFKAIVPIAEPLTSTLQWSDPEVECQTLYPRVMDLNPFLALGKSLHFKLLLTYIMSEL